MLGAAQVRERELVHQLRLEQRVELGLAVVADPEIPTGAGRDAVLVDGRLVGREHLSVRRGPGAVPRGHLGQRDQHLFLHLVGEVRVPLPVGPEDRLGRPVDRLLDDVALLLLGAGRGEPGHETQSGLAVQLRMLQEVVQLERGALVVDVDGARLRHLVEAVDSTLAQVDVGS